ncbi:MAG: hypothetical protein ACUVS4_15840 [Chloroflexaceae bacterium]
MTTYYGHHTNEQYPIAARIWGHRLRTGQHWIEYMLEFLSVLAGFKYRLGQGLPDRDGEENYLSEYVIPQRLGLRRFVFYDEREKTRDSRDSRATVELRAQLRQLLADQSDVELLEQARSLLRSFSAVEEQRSWFAKSLFPVHEEFLLWEALRKGSTRKEYRLSVDDLPLAQLDQGLEFRARNFFARGGEIYYLIISAGTEHDPERRQRISHRLQKLLTENNQALGHLARAIDAAWGHLVATNNGHIRGTLGWIPDPDCPLYRHFAADLDTFLDNDLDSLECLELLAHLIGFHIISYIYHRAHPASHPEGHRSGSCLEACRPDLLIDLLGDQDGGIVRECSASLLREQDDRQLRRARDLVMERVATWAAAAPAQSDRLLAYLEDEAQQYFGVLRTRTKHKFDNAVREIQMRYTVGEVSRETLVKAYGDTIFEAMSSDFRQNFLAVHRKIGRAIGLIAPRKGGQVRFVLGDTLLKTLVLATLPRGDAPVRLGDFLKLLYERYGIVIGPGEAHAADLVERLRINEEYYSWNREALRARMQRAGLLTEYSDATALVHRR